MARGRRKESFALPLVRAGHIASCKYRTKVVNRGGKTVGREGAVSRIIGVVPLMGLYHHKQDCYRLEDCNW